MQISWQSCEDGKKVKAGRGNASVRRRLSALRCLWLFVGGTVLVAGTAQAQVSVTMAHNDIGRTGQNLKETALTPAKIASVGFGKLFSQSVNGGMFAQPLYVSGVAIPGLGNHNVVYAVTANDTVYAYDADSNGGVNAKALWSLSLLTNTAPAGTYQNQYGVMGTPVIDLTTNTMYLVSSEIQVNTQIYRLHALDIRSGAEKFGAPIQVQGTVPGTGSGSSNQVLTFDPLYQIQRAGLLLLNGVLYVPFGSLGDNGPWHGWIFSYNAASLNQINVFTTSPNGSGAGMWQAGAGLAAEVNDTNKPYGRMFVTTGNGAFNASKPYTGAMSYSMSVLDLDLTGGVPTVEDSFTPYNWATLNAQDGDLGSGGPVLLPKQTLSSGHTLSPLIQIGKSGTLYILDRNNLGGYSATVDQVVQEVQTPESGSQNWGAGVWGTSSYWNNNIYFGGTNPGKNNSLTAFSFVNGVLSTTPTSSSAEQFAYPGPTPSISADGTANGIAWVVTKDPNSTSNSGILLAYDATNLSNLLYSSNANVTRDGPGPSVRFTVPTVANGKVYVGTYTQVSVYGLLDVPTIAPPVITPGSTTFTGSQTVTIADSTPGAQIFYTANGTTPTVNSAQYIGPIKVTSSETITAIASATGYLQGAPVAATYTSTANTATPVISLAAGPYSGAQSVKITDTSANAVIYYTIDGTTPTTASAVYTAPLSVRVSEVVQAIATSPGLLTSAMVSNSYIIEPLYTFNFSSGFAESQAQGLMQFNGSTTLDDFRLQLTDGGTNENGTAFYSSPVNIQKFTTDFTFQISNPVADGMTFAIQSKSVHALGAAGGGLGYSGIPNSIAIKFDIYSNDGEGPNSTGLYLNGAAPNVPSISLVNSGIDLHSGDYIDAHITYDGTNLTLTLSDEVTLAKWSTFWTINLPSIVGGDTAYVGFTGGTGGGSASQKVTSWSYVAGAPTSPNYPVGFDTAGLAFNGDGAVTGNSLVLTDGGKNENTSVYFSKQVDIDTFTCDFDFRLTQATADGFAFVIQSTGTKALGGNGGGLGYANIPKSVAIKFDIYDDSGEGSDSTGVYINGAQPTEPSINLTGGVKLASGDLFHAHVTYDGTTLTWYLLDRTLSTPASVTEKVKINIPNTIGSNTAYVGFTASTGALTAVQTILDWTLTNP